LPKYVGSTNFNNQFELDPPGVFYVKVKNYFPSCVWKKVF